MSAQKFYVKTRMAEAAKSGKTVNAKDLRTKFKSGEVTRKGFGAPKKSTGSTVVRTSKNYSVGMTSPKARQVTPGKPKNYRRSQ